VVPEAMMNEVNRGTDVVESVLTALLDKSTLRHYL
jgi:hypothetical protein